MNYRNKIGLVFLYLIVAISAQAKITLPSIWGDNMVVQQQSEIRFQGKAVADKAITVKASWSEKMVRTKSDAAGRWAATLSTPSAGGPFSISISDGELLEWEKFGSAPANPTWKCLSRAFVANQYLGRNLTSFRLTQTALCGCLLSKMRGAQHPKRMWKDIGAWLPPKKWLISAQPPIFSGIFCKRHWAFPWDWCIVHGVLPK
jgi:hypothetical protein